MEGDRVTGGETGMLRAAACVVGRRRGSRARGLRACVTSLAALAALLVGAASAHGAPAEVRTLFLTETLRPSVVRGPLQGTVQPHAMVAQPGEEEGFILALRPTTAAVLDARVDPTSDELLTGWSEFLRVSFVKISTPSSGLGAQPGLYPDPLPPQVGGAQDFGAGKLHAPANRWSGYVVLVSVPANATAGLHSGAIIVKDSTGARVATVPYSIRVIRTKAKDGTLDGAIAPHDSRNFKVLFNFNPGWYRRAAPAAGLQKQYEQTYRTLWFLARHRAGSTHWFRAYPSADGSYGCQAAAGYLKTYNDMPWWADGQPGALPVTLMPNHAVARCDTGSTIRDEKATTARTDDVIGNFVGSAWFIYRNAEQWRNSGVQDHRTYFLNPFDEPTAAQNQEEVPKVNELVHTYAPGVKVLGTTWPMRSGSETQCSPAPRGGELCAKVKLQDADNSNLSDGGTDDLDGWVVPYFRAYGFGPTQQQARIGVDRNYEVRDRLREIRRAGGESWTYDLPIGTRRVPQLAIDAPTTDARFMFWPLAEEGHTGWFIAVSNRWVDPVQVDQPRDPWSNPLSWAGHNGVDDGTTGPGGTISNGWGSLFYPGYRPQLGLTDSLGQPVSSLRLERMRDGVEDANLMRQYRDRFGDATLRARLAGVLGPVQTVPEAHSRETFPTYSLPGLGLRMELARRQMLLELARG